MLNLRIIFLSDHTLALTKENSWSKECKGMVLYACCMQLAGTMLSRLKHACAMLAYLVSIYSRQLTLVSSFIVLKFKWRSVVFGFLHVI